MEAFKQWVITNGLLVLTASAGVAAVAGKIAYLEGDVKRERELREKDIKQQTAEAIYEKMVLYGFAEEFTPLQMKAGMKHRVETHAEDTAP